MSAWPTVRLSEVIRHRKGSITIDDTANYKLCRVQLHRRGVVLREHRAGAEIRTKKQQVCQAGDFLVAEMDAKVGGYGFVPTDLDGAIVSSHYFLFELDENRLWPGYLEVVSQAEILQRQIVAKGSTNYAAIRPASVLGWEVPLPPLVVQKRMAANFTRARAAVATAEREIAHQEDLVAKLKQAILQEAITGRLTAGWRATHPDVEPASQLLARIQAEKKRLIAAKKLRPEKPLPPIAEDEMPFDIPEGWAWCRFGDIQIGADAGSSPKCEERPIIGNEWGILKVSATSGACFDQDENKFFASSVDLETCSIVQEGDFLLSRANTKELVGNSVVVEKLTKNLLLSDKTVRFRVSNHANKLFANLVNKAPFVREHFISEATGTSPSMKNISRETILTHLFPLPPLAEQTKIVARVEALMERCRDLEAEIARSRAHAEALLQAVLREAFAPAAA